MILLHVFSYFHEAAHRRQRRRSLSVFGACVHRLGRSSPVSRQWSAVITSASVRLSPPAASESGKRAHWWSIANSVTARDCVFLFLRDEQTQTGCRQHRSPHKSVVLLASFAAEEASPCLSSDTQKASCYEVMWLFWRSAVKNYYIEKQRSHV